MRWPNFLLIGTAKSGTTAFAPSKATRSTSQACAIPSGGAR